MIITESTSHATQVEFKAMASSVKIHVVEPNGRASEDLHLAENVFARIEKSCTRFDPNSDLMLANRAGNNWKVVSSECFLTIQEAWFAYQKSNGVFDPRILSALLANGYSKSLDFESKEVNVKTDDVVQLAENLTRVPWELGLDRQRKAVQIGPVPIDLGGIGKGMAVRLAAGELGEAGRAVLIEAGGDIMTIGDGPEGEGWNIGVEDPFGGPSPVAVINMANLACATSSIRLRNWTVNGKAVHHLINPRTGKPGGDGLQAVTVVDTDPAEAEVWSKRLFLATSSNIANIANDSSLAALWVQQDGTFSMSRGMAEYVVWLGSNYEPVSSEVLVTS